jgi:hypothetical protein
MRPLDLLRKGLSKSVFLILKIPSPNIAGF